MLDWWNAKRIQVGELVAERYPRLPRQVIHNDFIPNNTLYASGRVTAVLDFEFAMPDIRVLDVANGLRNMLRVWELAEPWEIVQRFCAGYRRWVALTVEEIDAISWLMRLRNVWLVMRRLNLAEVGVVRSADLPRLEDAQEFGHWLDVHGQQMVSTIQSGMR